MIISHKHRFIYLNGRKVGGSAFQVGLSWHCGPDDIVTALNECGADYPQQNDDGWDQHDSAERIAEAMPDVWLDYRKVTAVRDPIEKTYSYYWWQRRVDPGFGDGLSFEDWFHMTSTQAHWADQDILAIDGEWVDFAFVARQERLQDDFTEATGKLVGVWDRRSLPLLKASVRMDRRPALIHYTLEMLARMDEIYGGYCERFGYPLPTEVRK